MKRFTYLFSLTLTAFILAAVVFIGCEGPAGAAGAPGSDGADGADGQDGVDANATCTECHNEDSDVFVRSLQAANSKHQTGGAFERSDADCSACHTHEGFLDRMESGQMEASTDIKQPSPPQCRSCHKIHINYDASDFAIRYDDPVTLWINDVTLAIGSGNVCSNCHQPRIPSPMFGESADSLTITNKRWGPHHGPQSALLYGTSAYEVAGSKTYPAAGSSTHAGAGCTVCHMPDARGNQAGGHTFAMTYEYHGSTEDWVAGCADCHLDIEDFDLNGKKTLVAELTDSLHHMLMAEGLLDADGYLTASSSSPLTVSQEEAGLLYNFKFIEEDLSEGVHNPAYALAVLQNSLEALAAN
jgi:hypothetical protein